MNCVLDRAVGIRTFLTADEHIEQVSRFVAEHFQENVLPLGYKAFLVAVNREACAAIKAAPQYQRLARWGEPLFLQLVPTLPRLRVVRRMTAFYGPYTASPLYGISKNMIMKKLR